jgi:RHS repeat-associated protein
MEARAQQQLEIFLRTVERYRGTRISEEAADTLIEEIQPIVDALERAALEPTVYCVEKTTSGWIGHFGMSNPNAESVDVPIGPLNRFQPVPEDRGQPTSFKPGTVEKLFTVEYEEGELTWQLDGNGATVSAESPRCEGPTPTPTPEPVTTVTTIDYEYDPLYRLVEANYSSGEFFHYTYDTVGNRLTQITHGETNSYTYDTANRLTSVDGVTYSWDEKGNLLDDGTRTYTYDHANRLTSVVMGGDTFTFAYNGLGYRLQQLADGISEGYTLDMAVELSQVLEDGEGSYLYGSSRISQKDAGEWVYYLGDALSSVRQVSDSKGVAHYSGTFDPFGVQLSNAGFKPTNYGFTGEWMDESGLVYLRARYYAPASGRFLTRDTWVGDRYRPMSYNDWLYGYSNPIKYIDSTGTIPFVPPPPDIYQLFGLEFVGEKWSQEHKKAIKTAVLLISRRFTDALGGGSQLVAEGYYLQDVFKSVYGVDEDQPMRFEWDPRCDMCRPQICRDRDLWHDVRPKTSACEREGTCSCRPIGGYCHGSRSIEFATLWDDWLPDHLEPIRELRRVNNVIHELGHAFNVRLGRVPENEIDSYSTIINGEKWEMVNRDETKSGFFQGDILEYGTFTWVQSPQITATEIFADMFIGWVYNRWADDVYGQERARFMDERMPIWIRDAMNMK